MKMRKRSVRKQGWGWVNSRKEAVGFSRMCVVVVGAGGGEGSQPKNLANSCRGVGLRVHP